MFSLVCYLLRTYPEVTRITSLKLADLPTLRTTVYNTNPLLYNLPGVVGLKTGTTNMSGSCLVTAMEAQDAQVQTHMLTSIVFGAEDSATRNTLSEELLRYDMQCLREDSFYMDGPPLSVPADAETLIRRVLEGY
jgi:D-alanyl-D-alanine carboxypeptidase (penicillin-binding protein 5/6)